LLTSLIRSVKKNKKIILFFDELPWLATKKSGFIQALDYEWNSEWSQIDNLILIVCGSAASWMLDNIINAKGGLHNRITSKLNLLPFNLYETAHYLKSKDIHLNQIQLLDLYMVMGGVPLYLNQIEKGQSSSQSINSICFKKDGLLYDEFNNVFRSLFNNSELHIKIIKEIVKNANKITRDTLLSNLNLKSGGLIKKKLSELKESGFIDIVVPYGNKKKEYVIKVIDEYTLFYLYWIDSVKKKNMGNSINYWLKNIKAPQYNSWTGLAYEAICSKHINNILRKLQVDDLATGIGGWRFIPKKGSPSSGAQIDLIIDRIDDAINICEIKYSKNEFAITKDYGKKLVKKLEIFEEKTRTKKQIFLTMITTFGVKKNIWAEDLISSEVVLDDLFSFTPNS